MPYRNNNYVLEDRNKLEIKLESFIWSKINDGDCFAVLSKFLRRKLFVIERKIIDFLGNIYPSGNIYHPGDFYKERKNYYKTEYKEEFYLYIYEKNNCIDITSRVSSEWPKKFFNILVKKTKDEEKKEKELIEHILSKRKFEKEFVENEKKKKLELKIQKKLSKLTRG